MILSFSSVDSDEDDEEEESHSSREVRQLPLCSFGQFIIIDCLCKSTECKTRKVEVKCNELFCPLHIYM